MRRGTVFAFRATRVAPVARTSFCPSDARRDRPHQLSGCHSPRAGLKFLTASNARERSRPLGDETALPQRLHSNLMDKAFASSLALRSTSHRFLIIGSPDLRNESGSGDGTDVERRGL